MTARLDIVIRLNVDFNLTLFWREAGRRPFNLTGYGAKMQIRHALTGVLIEELSTANGKIQIVGAEGKITLALTAAETGLISPDDAVYDLILTSAGGQKTSLVEGNANLLPGVTI